MPVTPGSIQNTPYIIQSTRVRETGVIGTHHIHDPTDRQDHAIRAFTANIQAVSFAANGAGDTYYLPYAHNEIHSMRLPANPGFNAFFTTANLDGCWIFIEEKTNGDVIVYHANASGTAHSPTAQQSATQPLVQTAAAVAKLKADFAAARAHYPDPTANAWRLRKSRYLRTVDAELARKTAQGRNGINFNGPEHGSYTTFVGFYNHPNWTFHYQTYSQFIYRRPFFNASFWKGRNHAPDVTQDNFRMMEACRILTI